MFTVERPSYEQGSVYAGEVDFNNIVFMRDELVEQLEGLNVYKSIGPDGLHQRVLKETREQLADPDPYFQLINGEWRGPRRLESC